MKTGSQHQAIDRENLNNARDGDQGLSGKPFARTEARKAPSVRKTRPQPRSLARQVADSPYRRFGWAASSVVSISGKLRLTIHHERSKSQLMDHR